MECVAFWNNSGNIEHGHSGMHIIAENFSNTTSPSASLWTLHNHLEKEIDVTIRSQIIRNINKQFPPNIKSFDDIPIESKYYKTKRNENFMIFKNTDLIIFQSSFQAYLFSNYHKNIFADGTFYATPKFSYQLFITRTYVGEFNMSNTLIITIINFHCDFEQGISNAAKKQKIFSATDEIKILIENYKSKEINLLYNGCNRNELVKLWKDCLIDLKDININLK
ncbi:hypothetical protein H8356DRAFT_1429425 [Neocallimastix lanati (nom. inval.)]|nr:hypothetical protein H8356DRAFT_1429425 [Neocallimastix sp. JGI-2020a]